MQMLSDTKLQKEKEELIQYWESSGIIKDKSVLDAFRCVPREEFMAKNVKALAYKDSAFPLMDKQTISQPRTVLLMLQALDVKEGMKVLEVGAGSGYNAALISMLVGKKGKVITTEIIKSLAEYATKRLKEYRNVEVIHTDGSQGYEKESKYDRIIVTAACKEIPQPLHNQLKNDGILLAPVGSSLKQILTKVTKTKKESLGEFVFVPLTGKFGKN